VGWPGSRADEASAASPVEEYLDRLLVAAPGPPRQVRALLSESEAHLWDATDEGVARGLDRLDAEREAVDRFGPVRSLTSAEARRQALPFSTLVRQVVASAWLLGAIGAIAVGVSGLVNAVLEWIGGSTFVVDISSHTYLPPSDCARWLAQNPGAHTCYQAALSDWAGEVVMYRVAVGLVGLAALAGYVVLRRRWTRRHLFATLPASIVDTVAATVFGLSGLWLLGLGVDWAIQGHNGAGQWLGAAPIALALAAIYGVRLIGDLRRPPPVPA
jgi:hypothetical protein